MMFKPLAKHFIVVVSVYRVPHHDVSPYRHARHVTVNVSKRNSHLSKKMCLTTNELSLKCYLKSDQIF